MIIPNNHFQAWLKSPWLPWQVMKLFMFNSLCLVLGKPSHKPFLFLCTFRSLRGISELAKQCCHWNAFRKSGMQHTSQYYFDILYDLCYGRWKSASQTERKRYVAASEICHIQYRDYPIKPYTFNEYTYMTCQVAYMRGYMMLKFLGWFSRVTQFMMPTSIFAVLVWAHFRISREKVLCVCDREMMYQKLIESTFKRKEHAGGFF